MDIEEWAGGRELLTLTETAELLGVPIRAIYRLVELGELTALSEPGRLMLSVASIATMLERHTIYPPVSFPDRPHYFDSQGLAISEAEAFWRLAARAKPSGGSAS
jgi:excisionase family DNA binding protein